jgi:hypothetical protein
VDAPELGYRLVIRIKPPQQPHQLYVATSHSPGDDDEPRSKTGPNCKPCPRSDL